MPPNPRGGSGWQRKQRKPYAGFTIKPVKVKAIPVATESWWIGTTRAEFTAIVNQRFVLSRSAEVSTPPMTKRSL